jgi:hypothetical protein
MNADAPRQLVRASFDDPEDARAAVTGVEGLGIDAVDIHLRGRDLAVPTPEAALETDLDATAEVAGGYALGGLIGMIVGGLLAIGAVLVIRPDALAGAMLIAAIGGGIAGFLIGGYWGAARRLPIAEAAWDMFQTDAQESKPIEVEVRVDDAGAASDVLRVMRTNHARIIERAAA